MFRAYNASGTEGIGLGLFSVKKIAESVSGSVSVVSEEGVGTVFTVLLPRGGMPAKAGTRRLA
jgi:signal transduction histidine kinase